MHVRHVSSILSTLPGECKLEPRHVSVQQLEVADCKLQKLQKNSFLVHSLPVF